MKYALCIAVSLIIEFLNVVPVTSQCSAWQSRPHRHASCTDGVNLGSVCTYSCDPTYAMWGKKHITCSLDEMNKPTWSHIDPICALSNGECSQLSPPVNGEMDCTGEHHVGSVCTSTCLDGATLQGNPVSTCQDPDHDKVGTWSSTVPTCQASATTCEPPLANPLNGQTTCSDANIEGSSCTFTCNIHYTLSIANYIVNCFKASPGVGAWSSHIPTCQETAATCEPPLANPMNGQTTCSNANNEGSSCTFNCNTHYMPSIANHVVNCVKSSPGVGAWSSQIPTCQETAATCEPPLANPGNGQTTCSNANNEGSSCTFTCNTHYMPSIANHVVNCVKSSPGVAAWSSQIPTCQESAATCDPPLASPGNGQTTCSNANNEGSSCTFTCNTHYTSSIANHVVNCVKSSPGVGTWSSQIPTCEEMAVTCEPPLANPENGETNCNMANNEESTCTFNCNFGYLPSIVNHVSNCVKSGVGVGTWSSEIPTCDEIPVFCPEIDQTQLTEATQYTCTEENKKNSKCDFKCDKGTVLSGNVDSVSCLDSNNDGIAEWTHEFPNCFASTCETLQIDNGQPKCTLSFGPGSVCVISCSSGFYPSSWNPISCSSKGEWNASAPECLAMNCLPQLEPMLGSTVTCDNTNKPASTCSMKCLDNSEKSGKTVSLTCADPTVRKGAGFWNDSLVSCIGCGKGFVDIMLLLDGSSHFQSWNFDEMKNWLTFLMEQFGPNFDSGMAWIGMAIFGGQGQTCNPSNSISTFQIEMEMGPNKFGHLRQKIQSLKTIGGCSHLGSSISHTVSHLVERQRPHATPVVILMFAGPTQDDLTGPVTMAKAAGIQFIVVGVGEASAVNFLEITESKEAIFYIPTVDLFQSTTFHFLDILIKIDCPGFSQCAGSIPNGQLKCKPAIARIARLKEICTVNCKSGYSLLGNQTIMCGDMNGDGNMEWISSRAECKEIRCPEKQAPVDGFLTCSNANLFPSLCVVLCVPDYFLIGTSQSFCGDPDQDGIGDWNAATPKCVKELYCLPLLSDPPNGKVKCSKNNTFGSLCHFSCGKDYTTEGKGIVHCGNPLPDGDVEWSDPPPTCKACQGVSCQKDMMLVVDGSGSIQSRDFMKMKKWLIEILDEFKGEIDSGGTRVGLIQYSGTATFMCSSGAIQPKYRVEIDLGIYTFNDVHAKVMSIGHLKGCTATGDAISRAVQHFDALGRSDVDKIMIVVTDGKSNDEVVKPSVAAKNKNIKIIAIGIGKFEPTQLRTMSSSSKIINVSDFNELESAVATIQEEIRQSDVIIPMPDSNSRLSNSKFTSVLLSVLILAHLVYQ